MNPIIFTRRVIIWCLFVVFLFRYEIQNAQETTIIERKGFSPVILKSNDSGIVGDACFLDHIQT